MSAAPVSARTVFVNNNALICVKCQHLWNPSLSCDCCYNCKEPARDNPDDPNPITILAWRVRFHNKMAGKLQLPPAGTKHECQFCDREESKEITTYTYAYETGSLVLWICIHCLRAGRNQPHSN